MATVTHDHFLEYEDGYEHIVCEAHDEAPCHALWRCDCETWSDYEIRDHKPAHLTYDYETDSDVWHEGVFRPSHCMHQDLFDSDSVHGKFRIPVDPQWEGEWFEYHIGDKDV